MYARKLMESQEDNRGLKGAAASRPRLVGGSAGWSTAQTSHVTRDSALSYGNLSGRKGLE